MKLFIIYTDLSDNLNKWKAVLENLALDYKHAVCLVSLDAAATKARLLSMDQRFDVVRVSEMKNNKYHIHQITDAQNAMSCSEDDTFIVMPDLLMGFNFQKIMPHTGVIMMDDDHFYFGKLKKLSEKYKRSKSEEFCDVSTLLMLTIYEYTHWWPIIPKENLEAQRNFLVSVLNRADNFPEESRDECILKTQDEFIKKQMMDDVLFSPPNVMGLKWKMFATTNMPIHDLIKNAEKGEAKNSAKVGGLSKVESDSTENDRLLSSPVSRYGAV